MARVDRAEAARQSKEAKQKKVLIALAPLLLGLLAWQGPGTFKALTGGDPPPPPPAQAAPPVDPAGAPPTTQGDGTGEPTASGTLEDTEPRPSSGIDRLVSFSRFIGRDPFKVTVGTTVVDQGPNTTPSVEDPAALFQVNGNAQTVTVGGSFPASDPTFTLVSLTADSAEVGLVTGTFEGGADTVTFEVGETIDLAGDGTTFSVTLVSISNAA